MERRSATTTQTKPKRFGKRKHHYRPCDVTTIDDLETPAFQNVVITSEKPKRVKIVCPENVQNVHKQIVGKKVQSKKPAQSKVRRKPGVSKSTRLTRLIEAGCLTEGQIVFYRSRTGKLMNTGRINAIKGSILCGHCNKDISITEFEAHAGSSVRKPCLMMYTCDGRNLQAMSDAIEGKAPMSKLGGHNNGLKPVNMGTSIDWNDDLCRVCNFGGELICCDACPAAFHIECLGFDSVPEGDWFCPSCRCAICEKSNFSREKKLSKNTMLLCEQCEREFHVSCIEARDNVVINTMPEDWFCSNSCAGINRFFADLQRKGENTIDHTMFSWHLIHGNKMDASDLLGKRVLKHCINVMEECFLPLKDSATQRNLLPMIVQAKKFNQHDYRGFRVFALCYKQEVVCLATVRIFGSKCAEMPFIATPFKARQMGMARRLMSILESVLSKAGIQILVLPALGEIKDMWCNCFGLNECTPIERKELLQYRILAFPGCTLMQKKLNPEQLTKATFHDFMPPDGKFFGIKIAIKSEPKSRSLAQKSPFDEFPAAECAVGTSSSGRTLRAPKWMQESNCTSYRGSPYSISLKAAIDKSQDNSARNLTKDFLAATESTGIQKSSIEFEVHLMVKEIFAKVIETVSP